VSIHQGDPGGQDRCRLPLAADTHDLRHTCASLAISAGANVKVVQKLLGHKTAVLTLDRYGHLFPDDLDAVADAFDAAAESTA
jgi:integrase